MTDVVKTAVTSGEDDGWAVQGLILHRINGNRSTS
jgi:hypothetical protein